MMFSRLLIVVLLSVTTGCSAVSSSHSVSRTGKNMSSKAAGILRNGTRVEVFRIATRGDANRSAPQGSKKERILHHIVTAQQKDQGEQFAKELADILLDDTDYPGIKCFDPGVGFRVWSGQESVEILICFSCDNYYCGFPDDPSMLTSSFHGSPLRPNLVRLVKRAYPDDKEIQGLKE